MLAETTYLIQIILAENKICWKTLQTKFGKIPVMTFHCLMNLSIKHFGLGMQSAPQSWPTFFKFFIIFS